MWIYTCPKQLPCQLYLFNTEAQMDIGTDMCPKEKPATVLCLLSVMIVWTHGGPGKQG